MSAAVTQEQNRTAKAAPQPFVMIRTMGLVAIISGILIVGTFQLTADKIRANRAAQLKQAVLAVLPGAVSMKTFVRSGDALSVAEGELAPNIQRWFAGYTSDSTFSGVAIPARGMGFADFIKVLYGYDPLKEQVIGYMVLETKETPGLGDKIFKNAQFLANFSGLDVSLNGKGDALEHPIEIVKPGKKTADWQIDTITGATISSKAIGRMMQASTSSDLPLLHANVDFLKGAAK